ncbi:hypothetical protein K505DRAFT_322804 [Melanomma pulvis-pyrius CBS 109.77]|uniref:Uncharacterized protein n=1 Tax=Melanomma pulvis-pyrius CBS 109.77 TaxID=1314802 RepID=A0A6A6XLV5_9PLEO|nr:hypothetical protein K505DRAFT_322804 [Melanomma pulvis-pyrius CBS 109.77]
MYTTTSLTAHWSKPQNFPTNPPNLNLRPTSLAHHTTRLDSKSKSRIPKRSPLNSPRMRESKTHPGPAPLNHPPNPDPPRT